MTVYTMLWPLRTSALGRGWRVWARNRDAFVRGWKVEVGGIVVEPFVVLVALGFGLGMYVQNIEHLSYSEFVAPGILASYAMFHSTFDATYGAYLRMETHGVYDTMLSAPLEPEDIVFGEVLWSASRATLAGLAVLAAATMFGLVASPLAVFSVPVAFLTGLAFGALSMILTATASTIGAMNNFFTLLVTPLFMISGVFFPLDSLPIGVQGLAWIMPLAPAVTLTRALMTGQMSWLVVFSLLELVVLSLIALKIAAYYMRRRLIK